MSNFYVHSIHWETTNTKNRAFCVHFHFVGNNIILLCSLLRKKMMGNKTRLDICSYSVLYCYPFNLHWPVNWWCVIGNASCFPICLCVWAELTRFLIDCRRPCTLLLVLYSRIQEYRSYSLNFTIKVKSLSVFMVL